MPASNSCVCSAAGTALPLLARQLHSWTIRIEPTWCGACSLFKPWRAHADLPSCPPVHMLSCTSPGGSQFNMLMKLHNRQTGSDRQMQAASKEVNEICERLRLPDIVKNSALEVFRDVSACSLLHTLRALTTRAAVCFESSHVALCWSLGFVQAQNLSGLVSKLSRCGCTCLAGIAAETMLGQLMPPVC